MTLASMYRTDTHAVTDGVWHDYPANTDGTVPGFKLARTSRQNKRWAKALRAHAKRFTDDEGRPITPTDETEDDAHKALQQVFFDAVLLEWRNFQPNDDGVAVPYSRQAAAAILGSDEWFDLYSDLNDRAAKAAYYRQKTVELEAKN